MTAADEPVALLRYGGETIPYELVPSSGRKTLGIEVYPDSRVVVRVPHGCTHAEVAARVRKRAKWINRQREYFEKFAPKTPPRRYMGGETHLYLGRRYRLKLVQGPQALVALQRGVLVLAAPERLSPSQIKSRLDVWYRRHAVRVFDEVLEQCFVKFARRGHQRPDIQIRAMQRRWGSLSSRRLMSLNRKLIMVPRSCIEYVVTHELCHLEHKLHGAAFFNLLKRVMPDWAVRKQQLENLLL